MFERLVTAGEDRTEGAAENVPDGALIRAALRGDEEAFARLVRRYLRKAMAVSLEYARTHEDAEDIVQETFRRVLENLDRFDVERSFEPWFFTILRNTARNASKSRRMRDHEALTAEFASTTPSPFEEMHRRELRGRISEALDRLPVMQRTCFRLCMVEGFSSAEAAHAVGLAESTVRVHVFRARQALQGLLHMWRSEVEEA
jgi:RNA polymerase sigma-70 factor (ECF subfamily)